MGDFSGNTYTTNDIGALSRDSVSMVAEQRGSVPENYPSDYPYYPMEDKDGKSLITKVGNENYSAWMKRNEDGVFTDIVLFTQNQVDNIPSILPKSGQANSFKSTGKPIYVNPDISIGKGQDEIDASTVSMVNYDVRTGRIVDEDVAFEANYNAVHDISGGLIEGAKTPYKKALLPNDLLVDRNVSLADLQQELKGYQLSTETIKTQSAESFLVDKIGDIKKDIIAANNGNDAPDLVIINGDVVSSASTINFEEKLQSPENAVTPQMSPNDVVDKINSDYANAMALIAKAQAERALASPTKTFNTNANDTVKRTNLDGYLDRLDNIDENLSDKVQNSKVNGIVSSVILGYLKKISGNETRFASESTKAIEGLRERGLNEHADILAEYAQDPSRSSWKEAKNNARVVGVKVAAALTPTVPAHTNNIMDESDSESVTMEEGFGKITQGLDNIRPLISEKLEAMRAMQGAMTPDVINNALINQGIDPDSLTDDEKQQYMDRAKNAVGLASQKANSNIEDAMSPANMNAIMQKALAGMIADVPEQVEAEIADLIKLLPQDVNNQDGNNNATSRAFNINSAMQEQFTPIMQNQLNKSRDTMPAEEYSTACDTVIKDFPDVKCLPQIAP